jgi:hypothetical protein
MVNRRLLMDKPYNYGNVFGTPVDPEVEVTDPEVEVTDPEVEVTDSEVEVTDPEVEVTDPEVEVTDPEVEKLDDPATYVRVNIDDIGRVNFRSKPEMGAENVISALPNKKLLRVISDEDPEWAFVETCDDEPVRGYIKKNFVVEVPAPSVL